MIHKLQLVFVVFIIVLVSLTTNDASAQEKGPLPPGQASGTGIDVGRLLAIGVGVIIGSVATEAVVVSRFSGIVGGVTGGLIGGWWYNRARVSPVIDGADYREASGPFDDVNPLPIIRHALYYKENMSGPESAAPGTTLYRGRCGPIALITRLPEPCAIRHLPSML